MSQMVTDLVWLVQIFENLLFQRPYSNSFQQPGFKQQMFAVCLRIGTALTYQPRTCSPICAPEAHFKNVEHIGLFLEHIGHFVEHIGLFWEYVGLFSKWTGLFSEIILPPHLKCNWSDCVKYFEHFSECIWLFLGNIGLFLGNIGLFLRKYRALFRKYRALFRKYRALFMQYRALFRKYRALFRTYRTLFRTYRALFRVLGALFRVFGLSWEYIGLFLEFIQHTGSTPLAPPPNTLLHTATHCNTLLHTASHYKHIAAHYITLQHTTTHTETQCNTLDLPTHHAQPPYTARHCYGVATVSRIDKITGLFCRICSLV